VVWSRGIGGTGGCVCESVVVGEVSAEAVGGRMEDGGKEGCENRVLHKRGSIGRVTSGTLRCTI